MREYRYSLRDWEIDRIYREDRNTAIKAAFKMTGYLTLGGMLFSISPSAYPYEWLRTLTEFLQSMPNSLKFILGFGTGLSILNEGLDISESLSNMKQLKEMKHDNEKQKTLKKELR